MNERLVIDPNKPAESYLLDVLYLITVPQEALQSVEDVEMYGTYTTTDARYDNQLHGQKTTAAVNIMRMLEIYNNGFSLYISDPGSILDIYLSVENYLTKWLEYMSSSINQAKAPPYELLRQLDNFAMYIHPGATSIFGRDVATITQSDLDYNHMFAEVGVAGNEVINPELERQIAKEKEQEASRSSMQDLIIEHQAKWMR